MIKITDYIHCYENVLDKDLCKEIIKNSKNLNFEKAPTVEEMETEKNSNHRRCYMMPLDYKFDNDLFKAVGKVLKMYKFYGQV